MMPPLLGANDAKKLLNTPDNISLLAPLFLSLIF
jgi:hypothetical protein